MYAFIQITEIRDVLGDGVVAGSDQTVPVQVLTGAIPVIIGISSLIFVVLAWFLWREFGWQIYKTIGADRNLKRAHLQFQIFVCLLSECGHRDTEGLCLHRWWQSSTSSRSLHFVSNWC